METYSVYRTKNHKLNPISRVRMEKGPLAEEVSPECHGERSMGKGFTKKVSSEFRAKE